MDIDTHTVSVGGASTISTPHQQSNFSYSLRSGDFDGNGYVDILLDRLSPGAQAGSLQSTVLSNGPSGLAAVFPTASLLSYAQTFPVNPNLSHSPSDMNVDGHVDRIVSGLNTISAAFDDHILFAPGSHGGAQPLGLPGHGQCSQTSRRVETRNGKIFVDTNGTGYNPFPDLNEFFGAFIFIATDIALKDRMNDQSFACL